MSEKFIRYTEDVDHLTEAWSFVMLHLDEFKAPSIEITAVEWIAQDNRIGYTASISGHVND